MTIQEPVPIEPDPNGEFDPKKYLPQKVYDALKGLSAIVLPALATLVLVLGAQWDWSNNEKIAGSITAIAAFLGLLVRGSSSRFQKATNVGSVVVHKDPDGKLLYSLEIGVPIQQLEHLNTLTFDVKNKSQ